MLILKRKNIVISMLVVLLIVTGYLNFAYNQKVLNDNNTSTTMNNEEMNSDEVNSPKITISDAPKGISDTEEPKDDDIEDVSALNTKGNFFASYRLERENTRKSEIEYYKEIINNPNSDPDMKKEAQAKLLTITNNMEKELVMEGLIKAKGFEDTIVIMGEDNVNVIVSRKELKPEEVAQILDIVKRESGKSPDSIKIIPMV